MSYYIRYTPDKPVLHSAALYSTALEHPCVT